MDSLFLFCCWLPAWECQKKGHVRLPSMFIQAWTYFCTHNISFLLSLAKSSANTIYSHPSSVFISNLHSIRWSNKSTASLIIVDHADCCCHNLNKNNIIIIPEAYDHKHNHRFWTPLMQLTDLEKELVLEDTAKKKKKKVIIYQPTLLCTQKLLVLRWEKNNNPHTFREFNTEITTRWAEILKSYIYDLSPRTQSSFRFISHAVICLSLCQVSGST